MKTYVCKNCRKSFEADYRPNRPRKYCSLSCSKSNWQGRKHSLEARRKISEAVQKRNLSGTNNPHWKGGFFLRKGYKYAYCPSHPNATIHGYVLEHRLIVEKHLGRYLKPNEVVHHFNGNKTDNRLSNLLLHNSVGFHYVKEHCKRDNLGRFTKP